MAPRYLLLPALLLAAQLAAADTAPEPAARADPAADALVVSAARPLVRRAPHYPPAAEAAGQEGWVLVSFVVREDGSITDPVIEESSGVRDFEREARRTVKGWQYEPALRNGEPVEQCEVRVLLTFEIQGGPRGATAPFRRHWRDLQRLKQAGRTDEALDSAQALLARRGLNLYEAATARVELAILIAQRGDAHETLNSLRTATRGMHYLNEPELAVQLREAQLSLEIELGEYSRAIDSAEWLLVHNFTDGRSEQLAITLDQLMGLRQGAGYLTVSGKIGEWTADAADDEQPAFWTHQLLRRQFGIEDVEGEVRAVDLRCAWQRVLMEYDPDIAWRTSEDWGPCDVYVYGQPGTTFRLVEYPLVASSGS